LFVFDQHNKKTKIYLTFQQQNIEQDTRVGCCKVRNYITKIVHGTEASSVHRDVMDSYNRDAQKMLGNMQQQQTGTSRDGKLANSSNGTMYPDIPVIPQEDIQHFSNVQSSLQAFVGTYSSDEKADTDPEDVKDGQDAKGEKVKPEAMTSLVIRACASADDHCMSVYEIYQFVIDSTMPREYKTLDPKWRKNVRHILSDKTYFTRTEKKAAIGKGNIWQFNAEEYLLVTEETSLPGKGKELAKNATKVCVYFKLNYQTDV